jgi:hypothetical protein
LDAEVVGIELLDVRHVIRRQRRGVGRFCKFDELFLVVNVRQRRRLAASDQIPPHARMEKPEPKGYQTIPRARERERTCFFTVASTVCKILAAKRRN